MSHLGNSGGHPEQTGTVNMSKASEFTLGRDKIFAERSLNFEQHVFGGKQRPGESKINAKKESIYQKLICQRSFPWLSI